MIAIERKLFIICGKKSLLEDSDSDDFETMEIYAQMLIPLAAKHYEQLANRQISEDEWIDITVDPDSEDYPEWDLVLADDWENVKSVILLMASELYGKVGATGFSSISEGGLSQGFMELYSKGILSIINAVKRIRLLK